MVFFLVLLRLLLQSQYSFLETLFAEFFYREPRIETHISHTEQTGGRAVYMPGLQISHFWQFREESCELWPQEAN